MANGNKKVSKHLQRKRTKKHHSEKKHTKKYRIDLLKRGHQKVTYRCPLCKEIHEEEY